LPQLGKNVQAVDYTLIEQYAHRFGLGVPTGQTAIPENTGQISNDAIVLRLQGRHWTPADMYNLVIGQGETLVTPLQIARMVAALANGGKVWKPQLVQKAQLIGQAPALEAEPEAVETLDFEPWIYELIQQAMCNVTLDPNGTARYIYKGWYEFHETDIVVCGKTGTAQSGGVGVKPARGSRRSPRRTTRKSRSRSWSRTRARGRRSPRRSWRASSRTITACRTTTGRLSGRAGALRWGIEKSSGQPGKPHPSIPSPLAERGLVKSSEKRQGFLPSPRWRGAGGRLACLLVLGAEVRDDLVDGGVERRGGRPADRRADFACIGNAAAHVPKPTS